LFLKAKFQIAEMGKILIVDYIIRTHPN